VSSNEENIKTKGASPEGKSMDNNAVEPDSKQESTIRKRKQPRIAAKAIKETSPESPENSSLTTDID
jgi:hypothetical protein